MHKYFKTIMSVEYLFLHQIVPGAGRQQANVTVTWSHVSKSHRKKNPAPDGAQEEGRYAWEMAGWSPCSRTCGEGSQTQIWYCRDRKTDHVVRRKHCMASQDEPIIATRLCNTFRSFNLNLNSASQCLGFNRTLSMRASEDI